MKPTRLQQLRQEVVYPLLIIALAVMAFYSPVLGAEFARKDEWVHVAFALPEARNHPALPKVIDMMNSYQGVIARDRSVGRFRPAYYAIVVLRAELFGLNAGLLHAQTLLAAALTALLGFLILRRIQVVWFAALLSAIALLIASDGKIWWETMIAETPGLFFSLSSILLTIEAARRQHPRRLEIGALILMAVAALCKETFVLLIPAQVTLYLVLNVHFRRQTIAAAFKRSLFYALPASILFALCGVVILQLYFAGGYGTDVVDAARRPVSDVVISALKNFGPPLIFWLPVGVWLLTLWRSPPVNRLKFAGFAAVVVLWVVPQLFIYRNSPDFHRHYAYPLVVIFIAIQGYALSALWKSGGRRKIAAAALGGVWCVAIFTAGQTVSQNASFFAAQSRAMQQMMARAAAVTIDGKQTVFLAPLQDAYRIYVLQQFGLHGVLQPAVFDFMGSDSNLARRLADIQREEYGYDPADTRIENIAAVGVVIPSYKTLTSYPSWFDPQDWQQLRFTEPVVRLTLGGYTVVDAAYQDLYLPLP